MKKITLLLAIINFSLAAQNWEWAKNIGSWASERGFSISSDKFDNLYIAGSSYYFTGGGGSFYYPMFWKLDKNGNVLWQDTLWGDANVATDSIGNSYIACSDKVAKYNSLGQLLWTKTYPNCFFRPIAISPLGGYVILGNTKVGNVTTGCIYYCDINGNIVWSYLNSTTPPAFPQAVSFNKFGDIFVVGGTYPDSVTGNQGYLEKIGSAGNMLLHKSLPNVSGVAIDSQQNVYVTGAYSGTINIDGIIYNPSNKTYQHIILYNSQLNYSWHKFILSEYMSTSPKIKVDKFDHANVCNDFYPYLSIDAYTFTTTTSTSECFVAKIDVTGTTKYVLTSTSNAPYNGAAMASDLIINGKGEVFITGQVSGEYAGHTFGSTVLPISGMYNDLLVAKISQPVVTSGIASYTKNDLSINVYPNPSDGIFTLCCSSLEKCQLSVKITNCAGQVIQNEKAFHQGGELNKTFDLGRQAKGIYFVEINLGNEKSVRKIVLE
jgi:hypothetical protein